MNKADELITGLLTEPLSNADDASLQHWGILGMKWGIRRYQNKDGSLTAEGKARYLKDTKRELKKKISEEKVNNNRALRRLRKKLGKQIAKGRHSTPVELYSDDELKALRWRLGMEKDVGELNGPQMSEQNREFIQRISEKAVSSTGNILTNITSTTRTQAEMWKEGVTAGGKAINSIVGIGATIFKTPAELAKMQEASKQQMLKNRNKELTLEIIRSTKGKKKGKKQ